MIRSRVLTTDRLLINFWILDGVEFKRVVFSLIGTDRVVLLTGGFKLLYTTGICPKYIQNGDRGFF